MNFTYYCLRCGTEGPPRILQYFTDDHVVTQFHCCNCGNEIVAILVPATQFPNFMQWKTSNEQPAAKASDVPPPISAPPRS